MAAREDEDQNLTTLCVLNTNDMSDDEEMNDAEKREAHNRCRVSPIHVPAEWGKAESTGNADPESLERRHQRAKRFGVSTPEVEQKTTDDLDLDPLYKSLGVSTKSEERLRVEGIREEAIHIRGINNMTTQDMFHFFQDFNPASVEWISDTSCNMVWLDNESTARALLKLSYDVEHVPGVNEHSQKLKSSSAEENRAEAQEESMDVDTTGGAGSRLRNRRRNASDDDNLDLLSSDESDSGNESSSREGSEVDEETGEKDRARDEETGEKKRKSRDSNNMTAVGGTSVNGTAPAVGSSGTGTKVTASGDHSEGMETEEGEGTKIPRSFQWEGKEIALPRGRWRVGLLPSKKKYFFLRFATKADVKPLGARVQSQYYMPQSNPAYTVPGVKGLTSESRKRRMKTSQWGLEEGELAVTVEEGFDARDELLSRAEAKSSRTQGPGLTSMDQHIWAAETERVRLHKHHQCSDDDEETLAVEAEVAVLLSSSPPSEAPPPPKRKMRMYADDLEEQKKSKSATIVSRMTTTRDARSMIESRRHGKQLGSERLSRTQDDLDSDLPSRRSSDHRGQHRDLRDRLGRRRRDSSGAARNSYGDRLGRRKDDFDEGHRTYEKLTIEVQQD